MGTEEWALIACVVFSGLWSGLLGMLVLVMHKMMRGMSGEEFANFLGVFLPGARKAAFNYAAIAGMVISPVVALLALDDTGSTPFVLTAIGLGLTIAGPLLVSSRLAEPNYDVILAWDPKKLPPDWERIQRKYFALNWIRLAATWIAFGLFLAALVDLLRG